MTERQRGVILELADNDGRTLPTLHLLYRCSKCDHIFNWMRINNIKGKKIVDWYRDQFGNSPYEMLKFFDLKFGTDNKNFILRGF